MRRIIKTGVDFCFISLSCRLSFPEMSHDKVPARPIIRPLECLSHEEKIAFDGMLNDPNWASAATFRDQCKVIKEHLYNERVTVSLSRLGKMFGGIHCVEKQFEKIERDEIGTPCVGRPGLLTEEEIELITAKIKEQHAVKHYPTYDEIRVIIEEETEKKLSLSQVRNFIYNHTEFTSATGVAMDANRISAREEDIDDYFDLLKSELEGVDARFLFNLDEVGQEEFGDAQEVTVVVPGNTKESKIPIAFHRDKRCTGLSCIAPDGDIPPPLLILTRKTIDSKVFHYIPRSAFDVAFQENGFMTKNIFRKWMSDVFIPFVRRKKLKYEYDGKTVLLMDGLRAHAAVAEELEEALTGENIKVIFLVPHTSDQTQPLDLGIFATQKSISQNEARSPDKSRSQTTKIYKILYGMFKTTTPIACCSAFRQAGLVYVEGLDGNRPSIEVRRGCARAVRHYKAEFIESIPDASEAQADAQSTRLTSNEIDQASRRLDILFE